MEALDTMYVYVVRKSLAKIPFKLNIKHEPIYSRVLHSNIITLLTSLTTKQLFITRLIDGRSVVTRRRDAETLQETNLFVTY